MPEFSNYVHVDTDISVDEFLEECTPRELQVAVEWLQGANYINKDEVGVITQNNAEDEIFNESLKGLINNRFRLTVEEEELIMSIAKKYSY